VTPLALPDIEMPSHRRRGFAAALVAALRPKQWTKNLVVFAGLLFTLDKRHTLAQAESVVFGFLLFCMISSVVYLVNDVVDLESDRRHPKKRHRPIARGELSVSAAIVAAVLLGAAGLALSFALGFAFGAVALIYFLLTLSYSFHFKHIVILDVLILAGGFVLRAIAGAVLLHVAVSQWFILCILMLALLLGLCKRRAELLASQQGGIQGTRRILAEYSAPMLDQMIVIVASAVVMSYSLYTIQSDAAGRHPYLVMTIPFVIYGVFRYLYLMHRRELGESPDAILIEDKPILVNVILYVLVTALILTHPFHSGIFRR
jgi:4-hydroxybenzoate polyprenyltransferase